MDEGLPKKKKSIGFFIFAIVMVVFCAVLAVMFYGNGDNRSVALAICAFFWLGYCAKTWKDYRGK